MKVKMSVVEFYGGKVQDPFLLYFGLCVANSNHLQINQMGLFPKSLSDCFDENDDLDLERYSPFCCHEDQEADKYHNQSLAVVDCWQ